MERIDNVYEVTQRLLGMIEPESDSSIDEVRFKNLQKTIEVTELLIDDIIRVARHQYRHEYSAKKAGNEANEFITRLREKFSQ